MTKIPSTQLKDEKSWPIPEDLRQRLLAVLLNEDEQHRREMSYEEFLVWADGRHAEWLNGKAILMSPASERHQQLLSFLDQLLGSFVQIRRLGVLMVAPFQMRLANSGREPDLLFVRNEHRDRLQNAYLQGPADLVIEIVSPESIGRDRGDKFYEYEADGVPEYWLLDPLTERAEFYQLDENGIYELIRLDDGIYRSQQLPGFWLDPDWLWQDPLPSPLRTLTQIAGVDMSLVEALERALSDLDA
ncbi:MAG: Uma2 family endonuclease [Caldilineaceae bacterium]|nr:Uma2 family endonuclease [Caldilineaceae bacterium]